MSSLKEFLQEELLDQEFAEQFETVSKEMDFALALAQRREELGLTQHALASITGIRQPMIARIEGGQMPTAPTLQKLAQGLKSGILFTGNGVLLMPMAGSVRKSAEVEELEHYEKAYGVQYAYKTGSSERYKVGKKEEYI